jgi:hypothetical protein
LTHFKTIFNSVEAAPHRDAAVTLPKWYDSGSATPKFNFQLTGFDMKKRHRLK